MRILSKFKDYYDGCQSIDREKTPLYLRNQSEYELTNSDEDKQWSKLLRFVNCNFQILGFCGKLIPVMVVPGKVIYSSWTGKQEPGICYLEAKSYLEANPIRSERDIYSEANRRLNEENWKDYMSSFNFNNTYDHLFRRFNTPLLLIKPSIQYTYNPKIYINPNLQDIGWHRHMHPTVCYQEIDMYLSNQLAKQVDPLPMADVYRRDAAGFDNMSFKKRKK